MSLFIKPLFVAKNPINPNCHMIYSVSTYTMHAGWDGASIVFAYSKICIKKHWKHKHYGSLMWFLLSRRRSILSQFENCMKLCLFIINRTERHSLNQICTAIVCTHRKLRRRFHLLPPIIFSGAKSCCCCSLVLNVQNLSTTVILPYPHLFKWNIRWNFLWVPKSSLWVRKSQNVSHGILDNNWNCEHS